MNPETVKQDQEQGQYNKHISLRITPHIKQWLEQNKYSPTLIFRQALKELGYKGENKK